MFNERIRPSVVVNLREYPMLVEGYNYWIGQGAFNHPEDFKKVVEEDIKHAREKDLQDKSQDRCTERIKPQSK